MNKIKNTSYLLHLFFRSLCWFIPLTTAFLILVKFDWMCHLGGWSTVISPERIYDLNLAKLFKLFEQGYLFEEDNIKLIKQVSIYMILGEFVQLIYQPLITAALTFNNPAGERFASITLKSANLSTLITAFIILVASWIIQEAHQLKSETQLTI